MNAEPKVILLIGLLMVAGLAAGTWVARLGAPRVLGYVLAGMLFSTGLLGGTLGLRVEGWAEPLVEFSLGIIAYLIGGAMTAAQLRRSGRVILISAVGESLGAVVAVFLTMLWIIGAEQGAALALAFAALAATTDPAGSVAVLHQYRSSGPLSKTLLGVAAIDDALGILLYSLVLIGFTDLPLLAGTGAAAVTIAGGVLLGIASGRALAWTVQRLHFREFHLPAILAAILLTIGLAQQWELPHLLAVMALGFTSRHALASMGERVILPLERLEETVFLLFFTLAGAQFEINVFSVHLGLVAAYFVARALGKICGAYLGASLASAPLPVRRWLGPTLIPQAGVAVGLAMALTHHPALQDMGTVIVNVLLANTFLCEAAGPLAARFALARAGEIGAKRKRHGT